MVTRQRFGWLGALFLSVFSLTGCGGCQYNTAADCENACGWGSGICQKCSNGEYNCVKTDPPPGGDASLQSKARNCSGKATIGAPEALSQAKTVFVK